MSTQRAEAAEGTGRGGRCVHGNSRTGCVSCKAVKMWALYYEEGLSAGEVWDPENGDPWQDIGGSG